MPKLYLSTFVDLLPTILEKLIQDGQNKEVEKYLTGHPRTDPDSRNACSETVLMIACKHGNIKTITTIQQILKEEEFKHSIHAVDPDGKTALHFACQSGSVRAAEILIKAGANVDVQTSKRITPLHIASGNGHLEIVKHLLEQGANIEGGEGSSSTPLQLALEHGQLQIVKHLLDKGANIEGGEGSSWTPLQWASQNGQLQIVEHLLDKAANIEGGKGSSSTPLQLASENGHLDIVEHLLEKGANIEAKDQQGRSALERAEKGKQLFWTWKRRKFDQVIEFLKKWSSAKNSQSDFSHKRKLDGNEEKEKKIPKTSV